MIERDIKLSRVSMSEYLIDRHSVAASGYVKVNPHVNYFTVHKLDQKINESTPPFIERIARKIVEEKST